MGWQREVSRLLFTTIEKSSQPGLSKCKARVESVMIQDRLGFYQLVVNVWLLCEDRGTDKLQRLSKA